MEERFQISMSRPVLVIFFLILALVAAAVAWSFRSGFIWTAICLIAVGTPFGLFYWYMLYVNTQRASIVLTDDGLQIMAPPFLEAAYPYSAIERAFITDIKADKRLHSKEDKRIMRFGGYLSGTYSLQGGGEALVLTNKKQVLCLKAGETYVLLGPNDMQRLRETLQVRGIAVSGS